MERPLENSVYEHRKALGLTQAELAEAVAVTRQTIISIEKSNYVPSVRLALRLATALHTTVEELFHETT